MHISANTPAIHIQQLQFAYDRRQSLIQIDDWQVPSQSQTFLYGASGSGKSTLLNLLCGILTPQSGEVTLLGQAFSRLPSRKRDRFRAQHIGVVFQEFNLIPFLTVAENIALATHFARQSDNQSSNQAGNELTEKRTANERAGAIFERLKLNTTLLSQRADQLSVGQRQRVSIARALINQPEILIADEPTSALDSENRDEFMQLLLETATQSACTVLFVSHDQGLKSHFSHTQAMTDLLAAPVNEVN